MVAAAGIMDVTSVTEAMQAEACATDSHVVTTDAAKAGVTDTSAMVETAAMAAWATMGTTETMEMEIMTMETTATTEMETTAMASATATTAMAMEAV